MSQNVIVIPMRAQVFTSAHAHLIEYAYTLSDKVLILLGSHNLPRTIKNPFRSSERQTMIDGWACSNGVLPEMVFLEDQATDEEWIKNIHYYIDDLYPDIGDNVTFLSSSKDSDGEMREDWAKNYGRNYSAISIPEYKVGDYTLNATYIRECYFDETIDTHARLKTFFDMGLIPESTYNSLLSFMHGSAYDRLKAEYNEILRNQKQYGKDTQHRTGDALVYTKTSSGEIMFLHVVRGGIVGNGLYAMAGGFADQGESGKDAAIRELSEELGVDIKGLPCTIHEFNKPNRDPRFTNVHTTLVAVEISKYDFVNLEVVAGDDAKDFKVSSLSDMHTQNWYADHYNIIKEVLGDK